MRLFLTSNGVRNSSMKRELESLLGKKISDSRVLFIPTAAYGVPGDNQWLVNDTNDARDLGWKYFQVVELTAENAESLREKCADIDAIFVNGGNAYYLKNRMDASGFSKLIPELLEKIVYVSSSAGGIVTSKYLSEVMSLAFGENKLEQKLFPSDNGLGLTDFIIKPHFHSAQFPERTNEWAAQSAQKIPHKMYFIDDNTAIKVTNESETVISEGEWKLYNA